VYACICHAVTDHELDAVITTGATSQQAVARACGAGTGCGSCVDRICDRLSELGLTRESASVGSPVGSPVGSMAAS